MGLSIRNQLPGTVVAVATGEVMAIVRVRLDGGQEITAAITLDAVKDLGIAEGSAVHALAKSTEVALATGPGPVGGLSIRNQLPGTVADITSGGAMAGVRVDVPGGALTAAITKDAVTDLGLTTGDPVVALIKSTEISLATA
ncbi:TOBE domain-containing protein [Actinacidiphila soli]|uniref:TOBE domain-containing protein n=1 Tax=Actinacidiphila soli TaxID=2487275 RepID=UPI000FCC7863|nr:TOBE domain-containing protein [Actinacidiphila soli]